jgi:DNA-binding CsgD family transcriptional regulator
MDMGEDGRRSFAAAADVCVLGRLALDLVDADTSEARLRKTVVALAELDCSGCAAMLLSENATRLHPVAFHDSSVTGRAGLRAALQRPLDVGRGLAGRVAQSGAAAIITAATAHEWAREDDQVARFLQARPISAVMIAPLRARSHVFGTLGVSRPPGDAPFSSDDLDALRRVAAIVSLALDAAIAHEKATGHRRLVPGEDARVSDLTTRETEVLALVGAGFTNREIGERLSLSVRTVEWHRARIRWKLGTSERSELVAIARTHLPPPAAWG